MVPDGHKVRPVNWKGKPVMGATLGKGPFTTMYFRCGPFLLKIGGKR
jgi:hypothetical protein